MAIEYCVLASGSAGNCMWIKGGGVEILIDCGLSARRIADRLSAVGKDLRNVSAVVCTHGHGDHIAGASVLARRHGLEIIGSAQTLRAIRGEPPAEFLRAVGVRDRFRLGGLEVRLSPTPHDAPGSASVVVADGDTSLGVVTDLGRTTQSLANHLAEVDGLVLEMNHDERMLLEGPYPAVLKRRIHGDYGHLSNEQSARFLAELLHPGLQRLTLAHLSEQNNLPELAKDVAAAVIDGSDVALEVAKQHLPGEPVRLRPRRRGQLSLLF